MKPIHVAIGIAGISLVVCGAVSVRNKMDYDRDGQAISKLITEYKAMGIPTNGAELVMKIPDSENAWIEIKPLIMKRTEHGARILYKTEMPRSFVFSSTEADLKTLAKYLPKNRALRDEIAKALDAKPRIQVPHNYDEGYNMLLPEFAALRPLAQEFCLDGYVDALHGDWPSAKRKFDYANRFASSCIDRPELIAMISGVGMRKVIYYAGYRMIEKNPSLAPQVMEYLSSKELNTTGDPGYVLKCEFLAQLTIGRNFDVPYFDRPEIPAPLNRVIKLDDRERLGRLAQVKGGDYVPESRLLRKYLRARLEAWKPLFAELARSGKFDPTAVRAGNDFVHDIPPKLSFFAQIQAFDEEMVTHGMERSMQQADINLAILKAIEIRSKTGAYPKTLESTGITIRKLIPTEKPIYIDTTSGVTIKAWDDSKNENDKATVLSFPPFLNQIAKTP